MTLPVFGSTVALAGLPDTLTVKLPDGDVRDTGYKQTSGTGSLCQ